MADLKLKRRTEGETKAYLQGYRSGVGFISKLTEKQYQLLEVQLKMGEGLPNDKLPKCENDELIAELKKFVINCNLHPKATFSEQRRKKLLRKLGKL